MDSILQILQGLGKSYFNVKGGSSPAIQVCTICPLRLFPALVVPFVFTLHCFTFLVSVMGVTIFSILDSTLKFSEKSIVFSHSVEMYTDPDPAK
jgi:hypothetical protein